MKVSKNLCKNYDELIIQRQCGTFQFEKDQFSKKNQGIGKGYHEVLLLLKFLQNKPQVKKLKTNYHDLYYTVIKNRNGKQNVKDEYENNESEYYNFEDFITPNRYIGRKMMM